MKAALAIVRTFAVLLGLMWIAGSALDVLGLMPYSQDPPPTLARRAAHSIPLGVSGVALAIPYRFARPRRARIAVGAVLCLNIGWVLYASVTGVGGYLTGGKSWHVLPSIAGLALLTVANLWAFLTITGGNRDAPGQEVR